MTPEAACEISYGAIQMALKLSAPALITSVCVGVVVNVFQTVTSLKDSSLTFVPKVAATVGVIGLTLPWAIQNMSDYFVQVFVTHMQTVP
jgi:flagellar biosynthetic protein FliQ